MQALSVIRPTGIQIAETVDQDGKPVGILIFETVEGPQSFVINDQAADIVIQAMKGIKDVIRSH